MSTPLPGVAIDTKPLDQLRASARKEPDKALAAAAKQFESLFMQMLLKSMRDTVPANGLLDGESSKMYTEMFDSQIAQNLSGRGLGIAEMLTRQLGGLKPAGATPPPIARGGALSTEAAGEGAGLPPHGGPDIVSAAEVAAAAEAQSGSGVRAAQAFVDQRLPDALAAEQATGVPAEFILGQAALESGWGKRQPVDTDGRRSYNLFGMKADAGWAGPTVEATTTEYVNGTPRQMIQRFRAYGSYAEAFQDYARVLSASPRYAEVLQRSAHRASDFARGLQSGGYATDPAYAEKLTKVINQTIALARAG